MTTLQPLCPEDGANFDALFRRYHREIGGLAYRKLRDQEAAADLVQDTFFRYIAHWRAAGDDVALASPRFFLWRIASNLLLDVVRRERRRGRMLALDAIGYEVADPAPAPDACLAAHQEYAILARALDELPASTRMALLLNRVEGMTHAEVAVRLGVSSSMVNKHIMRALRHCTLRLASLGE